MTGAARILVVEDEPQLRTLLRNMLELEGYAVSEAATGKQMLTVLENSRVSLVTLDLNLAGEDGLALAREVRARGRTPIIMITAKATDIDKVVGLEIGADDYITKPFNVREVLARVRAVLRRSDSPGPMTKAAGQEKFAFGGCVLDSAMREFRTAEGERVELTSAEFNLLMIFATQPARVLSRDAIMDLLKGQEWSPLDRSIDTLVARLRRKIEQGAEKPSLIKTVRGVGYIFATEVTRI